MTQRESERYRGSVRHFSRFRKCLTLRNLSPRYPVRGAQVKPSGGDYSGLGIWPSRLERQSLTGIAERHVETSEKISATKQVKPGTQPRRKSDVSLEFHWSDSHWEAVSINWNRTAVTDNRVAQKSILQVQPQQPGFALSEDRDRSPGVDIHPDFLPAAWAAQSEGDERARDIAKDAIAKRYRAHVKSWGLGTRNTEGMTRGCFLQASISRGTGSYPTNNSPSATTAYWPAYLSTSSSKCRRIHASSFREVIPHPGIVRFVMVSSSVAIRSLA